MVRYQFEWFVFSVGSKQTMPVASIGRVQLSDWGGQVGQVIQASLRNQQWGFIKIIPARDPKQCGGSKKIMYYDDDGDDDDDVDVGDDDDDDDDDDDAGGDHDVDNPKENSGPPRQPHGLVGGAVQGPNVSELGQGDVTNCPTHRHRLHPTRSTISTLCPKLCCHCGG
jgi:hypothetical protein